MDVYGNEGSGEGLKPLFLDVVGGNGRKGDTIAPGHRQAVAVSGKDTILNLAAPQGLRLTEGNGRLTCRQ